MMESKANESTKPFPPPGKMVFEVVSKPVILPQLADFVAYSHVRDFEAADKIFEKGLRGHLNDALLVEIEYADHLLRQGEYVKLSNLLDERIEARLQELRRPRASKKELEEELHLFRLMKSFADIMKNGALRSALGQAEKCRQYLARELGSSKESQGFPTSIQIYMFEIYLQILVFGLQTSNWVRLADLDPPWSAALRIETPSELPGVLLWFHTLDLGGSLWEASRCLDTLLPVLYMFPPQTVEDLVLVGPLWQQLRTKEDPSSDPKSKNPATTVSTSKGESSEDDLPDESNMAAMNLSRAKTLLNTILFSPGGTNTLGFGYISLYAKGKSCLAQAHTQIKALSARNDGSSAPDVSRTLAEIDIEQLDYSLFEQYVFSSHPANLTDEVEKRRHKDPRVWIRWQLKKHLGRGSPEEDSSDLADIFKALQHQREMGNFVGSFLTWAYVTALSLFRLGSELTVLPELGAWLGRSREAYWLSEIGTKFTGPDTGTRDLLSTLGSFSSSIFRKATVEPASKHSETGEWNFPIHFDTPLYHCAFIEIAQQLGTTEDWTSTLEPEEREIWRKLRGETQMLRDWLPSDARTSVLSNEKGTLNGARKRIQLRGPMAIGGDIIVGGSVDLEIGHNVDITGNLLIKDGDARVSGAGAARASTAETKSARKAKKEKKESETSTDPPTSGSVVFDAPEASQPPKKKNTPRFDAIKGKMKGLLGG